MPLYEYQCFVCEHRFERLQKVADKIITDCPSCGGRVRRLLGAPALQFKGSGWYVTDYGKGNGSDKSRTSDESNGAPDKGETTSKGESTKKETSTSNTSDSGSTSSTS